MCDTESYLSSVVPQPMIKEMAKTHPKILSVRMSSKLSVLRSAHCGTLLLFLRNNTFLIAAPPTINALNGILFGHLSSAVIVEQMKYRVTLTSRLVNVP